MLLTFLPYLRLVWQLALLFGILAVFAAPVFLWVRWCRSETEKPFNDRTLNKWFGRTMES